MTATDTAAPDPQTCGCPPMPEGFTDLTAWQAIHHRFAGNGCLLDQAVIAWQRDNQGAVRAAMKAAAVAAAGGSTP